MATTPSPTAATRGRRPARKQPAGTGPTMPAPTPAPVPAPASLFARLGLVGLHAIEPAVLASLATESPLLLVGAHGSGKSLLLERIAEALALPWRHYNASLLNFDDLVGYPLPDAQGQLRYVQTPASVWGAGAVFIDEISRARVDIQNRLFPIIHEKRVQGLLLESLRHRWAAMNPPGADADEDPVYAGSEALDPALADRFAFHVRMPDWRAFDAATQEEVVLAGARVAGADAGAALSSLLDAARSALPLVHAQWARPVARYVRLLAALLDAASHPISARRAGMLARNVLAVQAVRLQLQHGAALADAAWLAVQASMPFAAAGKPLDDAVLLTAHREAWRCAAVEPDDPLAEILAQRDPLRRVQLAISARGLPQGELTGIVCDALAAAPEGARHALAQWLMEDGRLDSLPAVAADDVAGLYREVACPQHIAESVRTGSPRLQLWKKVEAQLAALRPSDPGDQGKANLLTALFARGALQDEKQVALVLAAWDAARAQLAALGA